MPANQELLSRIDAFLGPMGAWVEDVKGVCSRTQMSLPWHFSPAPGACVIDSESTCPQPTRAHRVGQRAIHSTENSSQQRRHWKNIYWKIGLIKYYKWSHENADGSSLTFCNVYMLLLGKIPNSSSLAPLQVTYSKVPSICSEFHCAELHIKCNISNIK